MTTAVILDLENIPFTPGLEIFLRENARHSLGAKIAVADFGKKEKCTEILHQAGYLQINVPTFKDSADAQIIIQACLLANTPGVKEIIIVSNDQIFSHLRSSLPLLGVEIRILKRQLKKTAQKKQNEQAPKKVAQKKKLSEQVPENSFDEKLLETIKIVSGKKKKVLLSHLGSEFAKKYGQPVTKEFKKSCSKMRFITYLKSHDLLTVKRENKDYVIKARQT